MDMVWCQCAQNIGLSNHKLKSTLKCAVWYMHARPRRTDRRTNIMAIGRRFVLTRNNRGKILCLLFGQPKYISECVIATDKAQPILRLLFPMLNFHAIIFSAQCFRENDRRATVMMFDYLRHLSACLSVCLGRACVVTDHTVHFSADLISLWLDKTIFWAPWHQPNFPSSTWKRGGVWTYK